MNKIIKILMFLSIIQLINPEDNKTLLNDKIIEKLINENYKYKTINKKNISLLMAVSYTCDFEIVKYLVDNGANVNALSSWNETALMKAINRYIQKDKLKIIECLINKGTDLNIKNIFGDTALFFAVRNNDFTIIKMLVENKADVNIVNNFGKNILMDINFNEKDSMDILKYLIDKSINLNIVDIYGNNILSYALTRYYKNTELINLLKSKGVKDITRDIKRKYNDNNIIIIEVRLKDKKKYSIKFDDYNNLIYAGVNVEGDGLTIDELDLTGQGHSFKYDKNGDLAYIETSPICACPDFFRTFIIYDDKHKMTNVSTYWVFGNFFEEDLMNKTTILYEYDNKNKIINKKVENINYQE